MGWTATTRDQDGLADSSINYIAAAYQTCRARMCYQSTLGPSGLSQLWVHCAATWRDDGTDTSALSTADELWTHWGRHRILETLTIHITTSCTIFYWGFRQTINITFHTLSLRHATTVKITLRRRWQPSLLLSQNALTVTKVGTN